MVPAKQYLGEIGKPPQFLSAGLSSLLEPHWERLHPNTHSDLSPGCLLSAYTRDLKFPRVPWGTREV